MILLSCVVFMGAAQISVFVKDSTPVFLISFAGIAAVAVARRVLLSQKGYLRQKMVNALHHKHQSEIFFASLEREMQDQDLEIHTEERNCIYLFVTQNWLILTSPNGCLISRVKDIKDISVAFRKPKSKFRLKVDFFDGSWFTCPYTHLHEPLVELINKRRGVVS